MLDENLVKELDKVFYSKKFIGGNYEKLVNKVRDTYGYDFTRKQIKEYYDSQQVVQQYRPYKLKGETVGKIKTDEPFKKFFLDTTYFNQYSTAIITGIDLFSRYGFAKAFNWNYKNEVGISSANAKSAMQEFLKQIDKMGYDIQVVVTDSGSEFKGAFNDLLQKEEIVHKTTDTGDHKQLGVCERYNATLRLMIEKYKSIYGGNIKTALPIILEAYNENVNKGIGFAPKEVLGDVEKFKKILNDKNYKAVPPKKQVFNVGDHVRILLKSVDDKFRKIGENYSKEVFEVEKYDPIKGKYTVNGKPYRDNQLLAVKGKVYKYEKNVDTRKTPRALKELGDFLGKPKEKTTRTTRSNK
jgi:hypothetical protein